jgi:hypothetical protein
MRIFPEHIENYIKSFDDNVYIKKIEMKDGYLVIRCKVDDIPVKLRFGNKTIGVYINMNQKITDLIPYGSTFMFKAFVDDKNIIERSVDERHKKIRNKLVAHLMYNYFEELKQYI